MTGGVGEEQDKEIDHGFYYIYKFLNKLHEGRNYRQPSFQPLPLLVLRSDEQKEEEGAIEEIDAQMNNEGLVGYFMSYANAVKAATLNFFIHSN
ncbi:MAG: hypothetical protein EZS28_004271 [Streblomastix strix]|uniref:Uncharacterized protein n=1 Tax=Streblomastix strix TaxID=222440 RepID=A0A5J4X079_9EUKA|nr:MAG: hypothetical protein EZS28_004271 [Streblomastix strix]